MNELRTPIQFPPEQVALLKSQIAKNASNDELMLFIQVCQRTGLDPFARQIYCVMRKERSEDTTPKMTIQTSVDGLRLVAQRSGEYTGQVGPFWCGDDGVWKDVWLLKEPPKAAKVGICRKGFSEPIWGIALWSEFCQMAYGKPTKMWQNMGTVMLAKCAESQGLRRAFPMELSGLYTDDEMGQADNGIKIIDEESEWSDEDRRLAKGMIEDLGQELMNIGLEEQEIKDILDSKNSRQMACLHDPETPFDKWANRWATWSRKQLETAKEKHAEPPSENQP